MKNLIKKHIRSGIEEMEFSDFHFLASAGETNFVERKSIINFRDNSLNTQKIKALLAKEISAFANYGGGFILIGVEDQSGTIEEGINYFYNKKSVKEWIENLVWSCTTPSITDFEIKIVKKDSKYLFAIVIGENNFTGPYQSASEDKNGYRYFTRVSCNSRPIDGILVRDIMNRRQYATLEPILEIIPIADNCRHIAYLNIILLNKSDIPAEKVAVLFSFTEKKVINSSLRSNNMFFKENHGQFLIEIIYPNIPHSCAPDKIDLLPFELLNLNITIVAKNMFKIDYNYVIEHLNNKFGYFRINRPF